MILIYMILKVLTKMTKPIKKYLIKEMICTEMKKLKMKLKEIKH